MKIIRWLEQSQYILAVCITFSTVYTLMQLLFFREHLSFFMLVLMVTVTILAVYAIKKIDIWIEHFEEILEQRVRLKQHKQTKVSTNISAVLRRANQEKQSA